MPVLAAAVAKLALHLTVIERYGWHRDELYYRAAGQHLGLGYVDFPPVTALLASVDHALFGDSIAALRLFAVVAGCISVVVCALIARELGGGATAQALAAVAAAAAPVLLATNALFQTVSFDQLAWAVALFLLVRILRTGDHRLWPLLGLAAGLGLETKYTIVVLLFGIALGLVADGRGRALLRTRGPWIAAGVALLVMLPNLWWQARHGWASFDFFVHPARSATDESRPKFLASLILNGGPVALPLWVGGLVSLLRNPAVRPLGVAAATVIALFFVLGGKSYYAAPIYLLLFAAGAVAFERVTTGRPRLLRLGAIVVLAVGVIPPLAQVLPVRSEHDLVKSGLWNDRSDYADEIGWPELADQVARVFQALPPAERGRAGVVAENYGEAGAIDLFGPSRGLPHAASGHLSYSYWRPPRRGATTVVSVGYRASQAAPYCASARQVGSVTNRDGIHNPEFGAPILVCRLKRPLGQTLPHLRHFR